MLFFLPFLAFATQPSKTSDILVDPLLLVEAQEVWSIIGQANNPIWPGWDARKTPILIYFPGKQDLLVNHPRPPAGFKKYDGPVHSSIGQLYIKDGKTLVEFDGQNTSMPVDGVDTLVIADTLSTRRQWVEGLANSITENPGKADETVEQSIFPDPYSQMVMFAHEAFHVYQGKIAPNKGGNELSLTRYPSLSVENNVGEALESDFLNAALNSQTHEQARKAALNWLAVRDWRRNAIGKEAAQYEDGAEFLEGTAKYVEYRAFQYLETKTPAKEMWLLQGFHGYGDVANERAKLVKRMQGFMTGSSGVNGDLYGASPVRFRQYFSGMGIGALLDKLGANWHDQILRGHATLTDLARDAIHPSTSELSDSLATAKSSPRFAELTTQKNKLAVDGAAYISAELAKLDKAPGHLILNYSKLGEKEVKLSFTPFGILKVDEDRAFFRLIPVRGQIGNTSISEDQALPVLKDDKTMTVTFQLTATPDLADLAKKNGAFQAAELHLPGITLRNVKGTMMVDGANIVIILSST